MKKSPSIRKADGTPPRFLSKFLWEVEGEGKVYLFENLKLSITSSITDIIHTHTQHVSLSFRPVQKVPVLSLSTTQKQKRIGRRSGYAGTHARTDPPWHETWLPTPAHEANTRHSSSVRSDGVFYPMRLPSAHPISELLETNARMPTPCKIASGSFTISNQ